MYKEGAIEEEHELNLSEGETKIVVVRGEDKNGHKAVGVIFGFAGRAPITAEATCSKRDRYRFVVGKQFCLKKLLGYTYTMAGTRINVFGILLHRGIALSRSDRAAIWKAVCPELYMPKPEKRAAVYLTKGERTMVSYALRHYDSGLAGLDIRHERIALEAIARRIDLPPVKPNAKKNV